MGGGGFGGRSIGVDRSGTGVRTFVGKRGLIFANRFRLESAGGVWAWAFLNVVYDPVRKSRAAASLSKLRRPGGELRRR